MTTSVDSDRFPHCRGVVRFARRGMLVNDRLLQIMHVAHEVADCNGRATIHLYRKRNPMRSIPNSGIDTPGDERGDKMRHAGEHFNN
ncbi:hypothetical protein AVEN_265811-1 [Araneus ventricosus]|uniref:Uncharacterized protein n=1 Tax=Araneus ventricosus TaxID=182803 RepID=A0A4Y2DWD0_ARAVE|nr:hypothetical protein AVEN_265811-1 [Araneus ventricosus]